MSNPKRDRKKPPLIKLMVLTALTKNILFFKMCSYIDINILEKLPASSGYSFFMLLS
jgi:hypothetical protein